MLTKEQKEKNRYLKKKQKFMNKLKKQVNKGNMTVNEYIKELEDWERHNSYK